ncbi:OmpA family protein [Paractinoplanes maris]|uniref:OmpA family protein n=1 Tax=Paractinoplanes maris TaxID=1734446 RepID=UPI0027E1AB69|nr:OmpA family protein [Actinoplanes maris]
MEGRDPAQAGATILLTDVTTSVRDGRTGPDYATAIGGYLEAAIGRGDLVFIGSFDGSASTVRWTAENRLTRADANLESNKKLLREAFKKCLTDAARQAAARTPEIGKTDIAGAIGVGAAAAPRAAVLTVVIATDGLSNTGCLSLLSPSAGRSRWIDDLVGECPAQSGWPAALAGKSLVMLGLGQPADNVAPLETGSVEFLERLWQRTCLAARALSCEVSTAPIARTDGTEKAGPVDPVVTFVPDSGPPPISPGPVFNLSSEELFDLDSDVLREGAQERLRLLATEIGRRDPVSIEVVGHTDSRGTVAHNLVLSRRRAERVSGVLAQAGLPNVSSTGSGEEDPLCTRAKLSDGSWDEVCLQRDRRVEIAVKVKGGPA